jgi:hypothetical protein
VCERIFQLRQQHEGQLLLLGLYPQPMMRHGPRPPPSPARAAHASCASPSALASPAQRAQRRSSAPSQTRARASAGASRGAGRRSLRSRWPRPTHVAGSGRATSARVCRRSTYPR